MFIDLKNVEVVELSQLESSKIKGGCSLGCAFGRWLGTLFSCSGGYSSGGSTFIGIPPA